MAVRPIERLALESINLSCKDPRVNTLLMNPVDYTELTGDYRRYADVVQVLSECLRREITIKSGPNLSKNQFKWTKEGKLKNVI